MAVPLIPKKIRNLGVDGVIREKEVDSSLLPEYAVTESINFHFDRKGASTVRKGLKALGSTVLTDRPCVGMHSAQSNTAIAVFSNGGSSAIYTFDGSTWNLSLDGGTASVRIRFVDFASYTIVPNFNYNTLSSMRFWAGGADGASYWKYTGSPINPQNLWGYNLQFLEVYKSRIYAAGDRNYPSRLFFSSVISSTGNITWTPTADFVDINPGDGEDFTGMKRFSLELLLFKPNYIYRFRTSDVDPDPLIKIGTRSNESIIEGKRGLYFHHDSGFYRYSGGYPVEISRPISDIVSAIPFSQYSNIIAWKDDDHIYWSIGNITITEDQESETIKNAVVRYTESSDIWTIYSYANDIRAAGEYNSSDEKTRIVGTDNGIVAVFDSGTNDFGEPIKYRIRTKWYDWEDISSRKVINEIVAVCEKAQVMNVMYKIDDDREWKTIGQLRKFITYFRNLSIKFHRIKFQIIGISKKEPPVFLGLEIIKGIEEGKILEKKYGA